VFFTGSENNMKKGEKGMRNVCVIPLAAMMLTAPVGTDADELKNHAARPEDFPLPAGGKRIGNHLALQRLETYSLGK